MVKVHIVFKYISTYLFKLQRVLIIYYDVNCTKRQNFKEASPCSLLLPQLGVARGGDLTEVAYGMAQPTHKGKTVATLV